MPDNQCDAQCGYTGAISSTKPLRIITQYSNLDNRNSQLPGRPSTLVGCGDILQHRLDFKIDCEQGSELEMLAQHWPTKNVDSLEFERILGQIGNSNSTPVTPTSFLNPRNITEDQEMFADNFSRTLNKLKAEQEGWISTSTVESGQTSHSVILTRHSTTCVLDPYSSVSAGGATPGRGTSNTNDHELSSDNQDLPDAVPSRSPDISSPSTTGDSIMLPSKIPRSDKFSPSHRRSLSSTRSPASRLSTLDDVILSSSSPSTWSDSPLHLPRMPVNTVTSSLPTILTIATSLKQARSECKPGVTLVTAHKNGNLFPISVQDERHFSSFMEGTNTLVSCASESSTTATRYAISDPSLSSTVSTGGSLLASLVSVSSCGPSRCSTNTDSAADFGSHDTFNDVYSVLRPEVLAPHSPASTLNTICSMPSTTVSDLAALSSSVGPLTLLIGRTPTLATVDAGTGRRSDGSRLNCSIELPENASSFLLGQGSQLQHLTSLYPRLGNTFALDTGDHSNGQLNEPSPFLMRPTPDNLSFISSLPVSSPSSVPTGLEPQSMRTLQSAGLVQNGVHQLPCPQSVLSSAMSPTFERRKVLSQLAAAYQPVSTSAMPYESSKVSRAEPPSSSPICPMTTAPSSVGSAQANGKRGRRYHSSADRNGRLTTSLPTVQSICESSSSVVCADSSSDVRIYTSSGTHINGSQPCSKRSMAPVDTFTTNSVTLCTAELLGDAYPNGAHALVYVPELLGPSRIKPEALQSDSTSNHSESFSAETGRTFQGNTPPSSLDGVDQSHLKLERKRARNRVAARRCRERKISLIRSLECQVAERDVQLKNLEELLSRYRSEGERLRAHMEFLSSSYPSLKTELHQFPFLFQQHNTCDAEQQQQSRLTGPSSSSHADLSSFVAPKHFS